MKIDVYLSPGCSHREKTAAVVAEAVADAGISAETVFINVPDYEDAKARRCFGSPTIRVDGVDVEYGEREPEEFSTGCRFYNTPEGWQPVPRMELVKRGIEAAVRREARTQGAR